MHNRPILVVDDDDDVRNMLCAVLAAEGYPVVGAADGVEALTACATTHQRWRSST